MSVVVLLSGIVDGAEIIGISNFSKSSDRVVQACYDLTATATKNGKAMCKEQGFGEYWVCPPSKEIRLKALKQCELNAPKANDQPGMLYLLGLIYQDFQYQDSNGKCPEFFRFQEGSAVCVYTNDHYDQLIRNFPNSKYSDMAAFKKAETAYRYYECEGQELCSVENAICGWIVFLKTRPTSDLASLATDKIVKPINNLAQLTLDLRRESPEGLIKDIKNLRGIATKLSSENRIKLTRSLDAAESVLSKFQKEQ